MTRMPRAAGWHRLALPIGVVALASLPWGASGTPVPAQAGEDRVYVDVNEPRFEDTSQLTAAADLVVTGVVSASGDRPEGPMLRELHRVDVVDTLLGQDRPVVEVSQDLGSADGSVHYGGQYLLGEGEVYLLFLEADGTAFRTVGGSQGVFLPDGPGWVSAAPSRSDLVLPDPAADLPVVPPPPITVTPATPDDVDRTRSPGTDATTATGRDKPAPAEPTGTTGQPTSPSQEASGDEAGTGVASWLLAPVFMGGLVLGGAATFGLARGRGALPAPASAQARSEPGMERQAGTVGAPEEDTVAVRGLIAVADVSDSPVLLAQVTRSLRQAGVELIPTQPGHVFDTRIHHGVGWLPAPRPEQHLHVARVVRQGWRSRTVVLRPAEVEVYRDGEP